MRNKLVVEFLNELNFPYDDACVNYIITNWENDHADDLEECEYFEIDGYDVKLYWFDYVKYELFKEAI